ncbi:MAG: hypothetical protein CMJ46_03595 [Planctomyces sp.]|nr:hypothetical protein [Planctomyces sp.]
MSDSLTREDMSGAHNWDFAQRNVRLIRYDRQPIFRVGEGDVTEKCAAGRITRRDARTRNFRRLSLDGEQRVRMKFAQ